MRCRHCGDPTPDVLHLFASGPPPALRVGSLVAAKKATGVCEAGERGIVYEVQRLDDRANWGVIFESGGHDSFNACQVDWYLEVTGEVCEQLQAYAFDDARRLVKILKAGCLSRRSRLPTRRSVRADSRYPHDGCPWTAQLPVPPWD